LPNTEHATDTKTDGNDPEPTPHVSASLVLPPMKPAQGAPSCSGHAEVYRSAKISRPTCTWLWTAEL